MATRTPDEMRQDYTAAMGPKLGPAFHRLDNDHPPGRHDDLCNAAAGALVRAGGGVAAAVRHDAFALAGSVKGPLTGPDIEPADV